MKALWLYRIRLDLFSKCWENRGAHGGCRLKSKKLPNGVQERQLINSGVLKDQGGEFGLGSVDLQMRHQVWIYSLSIICFSAERELGDW